MTNEKLLTVLADCEKRAADKLAGLPVEDPSFGTVLRNLSELLCLESGVNKRREPVLSPAPVKEDESEPAKTEDAPAAEPEPEVTAEVVKTQAAPEPVAEPETKAEAPALTKDQVRAELTALANSKGVDVAAVMKEMGYSKLSGIPAERYGELLDKARGAA